MPEMSNKKKLEETLMENGLNEPVKADFRLSLGHRSKTSLGGEKPLKHLHNMFGKADNDNEVLLFVQIQLKEQRKCRSENTGDKMYPMWVQEVSHEKLSSSSRF